MLKAEIDARVSGKTKVMGLLGNPVEHSISPQLHNTLSRGLGIDVIYLPFKVERDSLEAAVEGFKAINIAGFNVTIPFKEEILRFLDDCSEEAKLIGAVNTVVNRSGKLIGYNTDAKGFSRSFEDASKSSFYNKNILILGAGGAARAAALKSALKGADTVVIANRTAKKALDIADMINKNTSCKAVSMDFNDAGLVKTLDKSDIIINTTPIGMHPDIHGCPLHDEISFSKKHIVYDLIYNPSETKLLKRARADGATAINGLGMLIYQGVFAFKIITGANISNDILSAMLSLFSNYLSI